MKKIISAILAVALVLSLCTVMSFAAEDYVVDLDAVESVASNPGEHAPHGYAGVTTLLLDYGNVITLGELDLGAYSACEVTYATDLGYEAQKEGMKIPANFSLKSNNVCIGAATQDPATDGLIAQADCINADRDNPHNPDGANWDKDERVCSIDLSNVDYSGEVWLSHFNSVGNQALIVEIRFVAKEEAPAGGMRDFNADTDYQYFDQIIIDGTPRANGNDEVAALKAGIDGSDGTISTITIYGWFANKATETAKYGYYIDDGEPIYDEDAFITTETAVTDINPNGRRYQIDIDVTGLKDGQTHVITGVAQLADGTVVRFNRTNREAIINYTAPAAQGETEPATQPATEPATIPQTGDATVAMFAVIAVLAMGAAVVFMKKKVF